jgi:hypothetical protein
MEIVTVTTATAAIATGTGTAVSITAAIPTTGMDTTQLRIAGGLMDGMTATATGTLMTGTATETVVTIMTIAGKVPSHA